MARLSSEDMADTSYGQRQCERRCQVVSGKSSERYLPSHRTFANLNRRLQEHGSFNENKRGFGPPRKLRNAVEKDVLQYFRDKHHART